MYYTKMILCVKDLMIIIVVLIDCCYEKIKKCDNGCYPSYIKNQVIVRGPTGPTGPTGATGTSDIIGMSIITTTEENSNLAVRNPAGNPSALTITPLAGGTRPVSAHLVITQIQ